MGDGESVVERNTQAVTGSFRELGIAPQLVSSKDWYEKSFSRAGDWDAWVWSTVMERPYGHRKPIFSAFVLMNPRVGKANAAIADLALQNRRVVFHWDNDQVHRVSKLRQVSDSWKDGWEPVRAQGVQR